MINTSIMVKDSENDVSFFYIMKVMRIAIYSKSIDNNDITSTGIQILAKSWLAEFIRIYSKYYFYSVR